MSKSQPRSVDSGSSLQGHCLASFMSHPVAYHGLAFRCSVSMRKGTQISWFTLPRELTRPACSVVFKSSMAVEQCRRKTANAWPSHKKHGLLGKLHLKYVHLHGDDKPE